MSKTQPVSLKAAQHTALIAGLDQLLTEWDRTTNPLFLSAAGQLRQTIAAAERTGFDLAGMSGPTRPCSDCGYFTSCRWNGTYWHCAHCGSVWLTYGADDMYAPPRPSTR